MHMFLCFYILLYTFDLLLHLFHLQNDNNFRDLSKVAKYQTVFFLNDQVQGQHLSDICE